VEQIFNMLRPELNTQEGGGGYRKCLVNAVGDLLTYITVVTTMTAPKSIEQRIVQLENFITENQDITRVQLGQLLIAERLISKGSDDKVLNIKKHATSVRETFEGCRFKL